MQSIEHNQEAKEWTLREWDVTNNTFFEIIFSPRRVKTRTIEISINPFTEVGTVPPWVYKKQLQKLINEYSKNLR